MPKQKLAVPADTWSHSEGARGATVRAAEVWDKNGAVYLFRTVDRKPVKRSLHEYLGQSQPFMLRNSRGEILAGQRKKAIEAAQACVADLALGLDPFRGTKKTTPAPSSSLPTVKSALDEALRSSTGGIFVTDSEHRRDMLRASDKILAALRTGPGANDFPLCEEVVPGTAQVIWRHLLSHAGSVRDGVRDAEKAVSLLYQVLRWLHERQPNRFPGGKLPLKGWKRLMISEWEQKFSTRYESDEDDGPRFTLEETRKLFDELHRADPRIALLLEVGPEQRAGQVIRATRKDLDVTAGAFGQINLLRHSRGKKATTIVALHAASRAAVDKALAPGGYLHQLETAFQSGNIDDYHLWPAGRMSKEGVRLWVYLKGGRIHHKAAHASRSALTKLFRQYQEEIGVELVPGRGFYGLRRVMSDLAEDVEKDGRVLRQLTGWKDDTMRRHYQRRRDPQVTAAAGATRGKIRELLGQQELPPADDGGPDLAGFSEADLLALQARLEQRLAGAA